MSLADTLDAWNTVGATNSTTPYTSPGDMLGSDANSWDISGPFNDPGGGGGGQGLGPLAMGLNVFGTLTSAFGALQQGKEIAGADEYNAALALQQGELNVEELGVYGEELQGTQRAMYAKAGVEFSGSPVDVALQSATNVEMDKQIARYNAQSKASMYEYEAQVAESQAKTKAGMGLLQGAASLALLAL